MAQQAIARFIQRPTKPRPGIGQCKGRPRAVQASAQGIRANLQHVYARVRSGLHVVQAIEGIHRLRMAKQHTVRVVGPSFRCGDRPGAIQAGLLQGVGMRGGIGLPGQHRLRKGQFIERVVGPQRSGCWHGLQRFGRRVAHGVGPHGLLQHAAGSFRVESDQRIGADPQQGLAFDELPLDAKQRVQGMVGGLQRRMGRTDVEKPRKECVEHRPEFNQQG